MRRFFLFTAFMYFDHTLSKSCFVFSALHNIATSNVNTQACTSPKDAREHTSRLVRTVLHQCAITPRELLQHFKLVERVHLHFLGLQPSVDVVLARAKHFVSCDGYMLDAPASRTLVAEPAEPP